MIDPQAETALRQARLSLPAFTTVVFMHIGLLWIALQATPALQVTRQVVYQMLTPITRLAEPVSAPPPTPAVQPRVRPVRDPITLAAPVTQSAAVTPVEPVERKIEKAPAQVVETPEPIRRHVPVMRESVPIPAADLRPVQLPAVVQEPAPLAVLMPEPAPNPAPAPAPAPAPVAAVAARPQAITPVEKPVVAASSAPVAPAGGGAAAAPAVPAGSGLVYPNYMEKRPRQKSFAELANEQLNPGGRRDKFADAVDAAEKPDCATAYQGMGLLAAPVIAFKAATDKCK